jgi:hypothetical protein
LLELLAVTVVHARKALSRTITADLGSGGRGSSCSCGRGSRILLLFIPRHGEALGVNGKRHGKALDLLISWSRQDPSCSEKGHLPKQQRVRNGE